MVVQPPDLRRVDARLAAAIRPVGLGQCDALELALAAQVGLELLQVAY